MNYYRTIHTDYGVQRMVQAEATGVSINLTHMAVGDGGGNPVEPSSNQISLVREVFRSPINRVYQDPAQPNKFTAEFVIPASVGGFVMREVAVFDDQGGMFAVGNTPDAYKPQASEGAYSDTIVRMEFLATNADVVTILVDPNVAVASQTWVINNVTVCSLLPGGTTGQILKKKSNGCGDTEWADPDVADVVVDVIEERQTLAASQTVVTLSTVTTRGLAVYIEGVRIPKGAGADEWQEDSGDPDTKIILGKSYPAGTKILMTQNEPSGAVPFPLIRDQNLSDVPNKAAARQNLGVHSIDDSNAAGQPGDIKYTARNTAPPGWLKANGAAVSRTTYAALFAAIGTRFGAGDGFNTFNLPDLRGEFIRGWDDGRGVDAGRTIGSAQGDAIRNIKGTFTGVDNPQLSGAFYEEKTINSSSSAPGGTQSPLLAFDASRVVPTAQENRPRNVAMLACIKY